ncbi:aminotransferase class III-fold pyridoxal phosphate-dependent enzyme [Mesorhizobium sp. LNJC391B00]|uniref:aminotransferase class III-fold pyridoxal phosphate-dependent enzyme n=1 Tax=Mesorhizobium sp. LNJC391B00 TaxID=1287273 RepID=UPI0003CDDEFB|nr:aminotransferase class III-fold pyridoxal phosphate-dependent enzyme [Mesorhizobium sp. LNJC391B00]ESY32193.1 glutamate-1-semialdehyde aminotransferase [Mesorhizobium sp. LNJC391B00]
MRHLVGGISSAGRAVPLLDGKALYIERAKGPYIWTDEGVRMIDTALGFGAVLLGHADPVVNAAVVEAVEKGSMPAFAHAGEETAADALSAPCGPLQSVIFTNSGSEAVHLACRLARAVTGRRIVAKIAAGFDGWFDPVAFGNAGSREAFFGNGESRPIRQDMTLTRYNDVADLERLFSDNTEIAAVIFEPMLANAGCIEADISYLRALESLTRAHGALLIADEILMGFRSRFGLASHGLALDPDIATVGKAIGNGFAVAAVLGRPEIMAAADDGRAVRAGTYCGNPVATAAVKATLSQLRESDYDGLARRGDLSRNALVAAFADRGATITTTGLGMVFTPWYASSQPKIYEDAKSIANPGLAVAVHRALRRAGVMVMPQAFGRFYLSFAHDDAVCGEMAQAIRQAVDSLPTGPDGIPT